MQVSSLYIQIWLVIICILLVFVELNVQYLPVTYANAGVTALVALVAIVTAKVLHLALMVDSHFINGKEAKARTIEF